MGKIWDKFGICASALCLLHCIATSFIIMLFPSIQSVLGDNHFIHEIFAVIVITLVIIAVYPQCHRHGHKDIIAFAVAGSALIISAIFLFEDIPYLHYGLTITGSLSLIIAHVKNMKLRHNNCGH